MSQSNNDAYNILIEYLNMNNIIYKRFPKNDKPTKIYKYNDFYEDGSEETLLYYYENGTTEYFNLFHTKSNIRSYRSLMWHIIALRFLNPHLGDEKFRRIVESLGNYENEFIGFVAKGSIVKKMTDKVLAARPMMIPENKARKVIFKDGNKLPVSEKLSIVGKICGKSKSITNEDIYEIIMYINDVGEKITIAKIAKELGVTTRTIYRNIDDSLKVEKDRLNKLLDEELQFEKLHKI